jgi:hypothetical protein
MVSVQICCSFARRNVLRAHLQVMLCLIEDDA